jgi:hypothetical protein
MAFGPCGRRARLSASLVAVCALALACGARSDIDDGPRGDGGSGGIAGVVSTTGPGPGGAGHGPGAGGGGPGVGGGGGTGGAGGGTGGYLAYVQSNESELYALTAQHDLEHLHPLDCGTLVDIALDASGELFATAYGTFFRIDAAGACTVVATNGEFPNSLATVPAGVLDPLDDVLVGIRHDEYVRIDKTTGAVQVLGVLGVPLLSSGDVTYLDGVLYATVQGMGCEDCLAVVDPITGLVLDTTPLDFSDVFGLADAGGVLYGFTSGGAMLEIDPGGGTTPIGSIANDPLFGATSL